MDAFRPEMNSNEKLARQITGMDSEATHLIVNGKEADKLLEQEKASKFNQDVNDMCDRFQQHIDAIQEEGRKIAQNLNDIEIMTLGSYVLLSPFKHNPFQQIKVTDTGLITDLGGLAPQYKNQENGQIEEEQEYVKVGMVMETGPDCKFLKEGDLVFYNINSEIVVPFFKFGYVAVNEQRVIAVVNKGLTKRKDDIIKNKEQ